jgi:hypothetical protein
MKPLLPTIVFLLGNVLIFRIPALAGPPMMKAGVAAEDITPRWAVRKSSVDRPPITAVYHPIKAKALAISDGKTTIVIVTADVTYFCRETTGQIHERITRLGFAPHQVILNASHSHSAPAICSLLDVPDENLIDVRYQSFFVERVVQAIEGALANLHPAFLSTAEFHCEVCINKRLGSQMKPNPEGPIDRRVRLLRINDAKTGSLDGVLFLYGCHPSDINDDAFGGDFFGFAQEEIEQHYPGVIALSAQGTGGDVRVDHRDESRKQFFWGNLKTLEVNRSYGRSLSASVLRALRQPATPVEGRIRSASRELALPLQEPVSRETALRSAEGEDVWKARWGRHLLSLYDRHVPLPRSIPYLVQVIHIGNQFSLVALDGEVFTQIGQQIEQALKPRRTLVLGYSNAAAGYIPTAKDISKGGYEIEVFYWWFVPAPFAPDVERVVVSETVDLARKLALVE